MSKIWIKTNRQRLAALKKEAYVTRVVSFTSVKKDALLEAAARNSGIKKGVIYSAMDAVMNEFMNFLVNGHPVQLPELGTFRFSVKARVADSVEEISADKVYRRKVVFTPSKHLKQQLGNTELIGLAKDITTSLDDKETENSGS